MKFNLTLEKTREAVVDAKRCIACGKCRSLCPTGAISEWKKSAAVFSCDKPGIPCSHACPLGINPQVVAKLIEDGDLEAATAHIYENTPMPFICTAVCEQVCMESCSLGLLGEAPVNIKALERYALEKTEKERVGLKRNEFKKRYREKIAVIGGGPSGISAAYYLAEKGYSVTVYEKDKSLGGAMSWGIPDFRLSRKMMREELERVLSVGIDVVHNAEIGAEISLDSLKAQGFAAFVIAVGNSCSKRHSIKGYEADGVYDSMKIMRRLVGDMDEAISLGEKIVIIGNGETAGDMARILVRHEKSVTWVPNEDAFATEFSETILEKLRKEGVNIVTDAMAEQLITENGKVKAVEMKYADKAGAYNFFCDNVIIASELKCSVENICNAETYPNGKVRIDEQYRTNKTGIFACGDATGESNSVVEAVAEGKAAALAVDAFLRDRRDGDIELRRNAVYKISERNKICVDNIIKRIPQYEENLFENSRLFDKVEEPAEDIGAIFKSMGLYDCKKTIDKKTNKKVAVVGGGIAGITAAIELSNRGHRVTLYEKTSKLGGVYRWFATEKRVDKKLLEEKLTAKTLKNIDIVYNVAAGIKPDIDELKAAGFDGVLFAIGDYSELMPQGKNWDCRGVYNSLSVISKLMNNEALGKSGEKVLIVGGDEITLDLARKMKKHYKEVTILSPYSKGVLQVKSGVADKAVKEGVNIVTGVEISEIIQEAGNVTGVRLFITEKKYDIDVPCDILIVGGQRPDTKTIAIRNLKLDMTPDGRFKVDESLQTSIAGVFSVGGLNMSATDAGRAGAKAVDNYLSGRKEYISSGEAEALSETYEIIEGSSEENPVGFETGIKAFGDTQAKTEAAACMGCGYHMIDGEKCMGCGICETLCPVKAIAFIDIDSRESKEV